SLAAAVTGRRRRLRAYRGPGRGAYFGPPVDDGLMELRQHEAEGGDIAIADGAILMTDQRLLQDVFGRGLHRRKLFERGGLAHIDDGGEQAVAVQRILWTLVAPQIMPQPRRSRAKSRDQQYGGPDVVAVLVEEGTLCAVDIGGRPGMRRQSGILVG